MILRSRGILVYSNKVLVIKIKKQEKEHYTFPGGHGKRGESLENTCIREFFEETGLKIKINKIIYKTKEKNHRTFYYLCELADKKEIRLDDDNYPSVSVIGEELERESKYEPLWFSISELEEVNLYPSEIIGTLKNFIR